MSLDRRCVSPTRSLFQPKAALACRRKIADLIGLTDDFVLQITMPALNAAWEAAGAGEQRRDFTAVVGEVRHLAQRSEQAAMEIAAGLAAAGAEGR